ncbi:MAG TPA: lysylphosphatidylglycerol synthase transmembrane domain-containing protein [Acidimicrobiales bacterium]|nr:lysylphosphatidylglycerol synthase transmembrane domain-containing protein [Acidimicrobiales bacterium]
MTAQAAPTGGDDVEPDTGTTEPGRGAVTATRKRQWAWVRRTVLVVLSGAAAWFLAQRGNELRQAADLLRRVDWRLVGIAVLFEAASMVVFARMQRWLLRAGGVDLPLRTMVEITLAGNAIAATLPGGVAWAAAWAFGQLRRRGVGRFLRVWVFLVAGAFSSFALFLVVVFGIEVAGDRGPVANLRWAALSLAAIPVVGLAAGLMRRWRPVQQVETRIATLVDAKLPGGHWVVRWVRTLIRNLDAVHLSPLRWAEVLGLAILNWLYDCAVLVCALLALHINVPWRGIFVIYGITQIAASLPITPGGLVVVEGSLAGLLTAYGVDPQGALATVILYRIVSFWGLVPVGWAVWVGFDLMQRRGRVRRAHPWAFHGRRTTEERVGLIPEPIRCGGCNQEAQPTWDERKAS